MINLFLNRIFRAIKIDIDVFEEVEKDKNATVQAGIVVVLSSLAAGVGSLHLGATCRRSRTRRPGLRRLRRCQHNLCAEELRDSRVSEALREEASETLARMLTHAGA